MTKNIYMFQSIGTQPNNTPNNCNNQNSPSVHEEFTVDSHSGKLQHQLITISHIAARPLLIYPVMSSIFASINSNMHNFFT